MNLLQLDKCIFTDYPINLIEKNNNEIVNYEIFVGQKKNKHQIRINKTELNTIKESMLFIENKHIFSSLLLNNQWLKNEKELITLDALDSLLKFSVHPKTPKQKLDNLLHNFHKAQKFEGEELEVKSFKDELWKGFYFKNWDEFQYYCLLLEEEQLIKETQYSMHNHLRYIDRFRITLKGLNYIVQLESEGEKSNKCFIAIAFRDETRPFCLAITEALKKTGFEPIFINEQDIDSERTINDEIIASLKKCKFCIADFSYHNNGVYFESGFALGQGKKVIYTCQKKEFENAHFDIKPLQHILYENSEELKNALIHKINAWIK